jgi:hypothetical protein
VSEETVLATLARARVLPVVALDDAFVVPDLCAALLAGGISTVEITFRTAAAVAALERAAEVEGMLVGAGTVLTVEQTRAAAQAGAAFAVAPGTDEEVVATCRELGLPFFPGNRHALRTRVRPPAHDSQGLPRGDARRPRVSPRRLGDVPPGAVPADRRDRRRLPRVVPRRPGRRCVRRQLDLGRAVDPRA